MKRRIRLLQIIDSTYRGGAQKVVLEIVKTFPELDHVVCYWATTGDLDNEFKEAGAMMIKIPFHGIVSLPRTILFVRRLLRTQHVDIIHSHMLVPNLISSFAGSRSHRRVRTYHGECFEQGGLRGVVSRFLERTTIRSADGVVAVSMHVADYVRRKLRVRVPVSVVYNFGNESPARRQEIPFQPPLRFVSTSNNHPYKNLSMLVDAFGGLQDLPVSLYLYGKGMESIAKVVNERKITNVMVMGSVAEIASILPHYDIYVAASRSGEGFSLALLEAMNAGLPVLCSDIPQFKEAVGTGATLFRSDDAEDLISKIKWMVEHADTLSEMSLQMAQRAQGFTRERFRQEMAEVYALN